MRSNNVNFSLVLAVTTLFLVVLGCGGGSSDACIGTVMYQGRTFQGAGKNEIDAKLHACNNYCTDADPEYDARYRVWLDSPKGKEAKSPSKKEAIFKDKDLFAYVENVCAKKCTQEMKPESKCK